MDVIIRFSETLIKLGSSVLLPVFLALLAMAFGVKAGKAIRCGLTVGVCLAGMSLLLNTMGSNLVSVAQQIATKFQITTEVADVGWSPSSTIAFSSKIGSYVIPIFLLVNLFLLITRSTRTINVDIWNYWQAAFTGAMIENLTGRFSFGLIGAIVSMIVILVLSDLVSTGIHRFGNMPEGVTYTHGFAVAFVPVAIAVNKLMDLLPGAKKEGWTTERLQKKFGLLGDPMILSILVGIALGVVAGRDAYGVFQLAMLLAAMTFLLPRIAGWLAEGITPLAQGLQSFSQKKLKLPKGLQIGINATAGTGNSMVLLLTFVLTPLSVFLAGWLPGNRVLPSADITMLVFTMTLIVTVSRGDLLRSLISGVVSLVVMLYCGSHLAELFTQAAVSAAPDAYGKLGLFTSLCNGANPVVWVLVQIAVFGFAGAALMVLIGLVLMFWNHNQNVRTSDEPSAGGWRGMKSKKAAGPASGRTEEQGESTEPKQPDAEQRIDLSIEDRTDREK